MRRLVAPEVKDRRPRHLLLHIRKSRVMVPLYAARIEDLGLVPARVSTAQHTEKQLNTRCRG